MHICNIFGHIQGSHVLIIFSLSSFSPSFQDKLDKIQIESGEDVSDLNYDYDNEQCVARGGNWWMGWWTADGIMMQRRRD